VSLLDKELFTDVTAGDKYETDLIAKVLFLGKPSYFLIHIEAESGAKTKFNRRMFRYFSRLHEKFDLPIYPIVIFSYSSPKTLAINNYQISFPDLEVLKFNYQVIQSHTTKSAKLERLFKSSKSSRICFNVKNEYSTSR
jgi:hypothetical protein